MIELLIKILIISFFINLLYELLHSLLYKTCIEAPLPKYVYLILKAAVFDGVSITLIYSISYFAFKNYSIFIFSAISIAFAYFWEIYSIKEGRWEYTSKMPKIFGVGLTPTFQLFITGFLSIYLSIKF
jgi:hypothetical protein